MAENKNTLSPMMVHYKQIKEKYPDTIVLYRLGDFYEMFFDDAIKASKILDLTLTGRDCGLEERAPMCGIPYHAVDNYLQKLLMAGEKAAICEQLTNPGDQKGILKRDIIRVITPGTNTIEEMLDGTVNHYLVSVYRKKGTNNYAVAMLDIVTGDCKVKELPNSSLTDVEDFLMGITPSEIISNQEISNESKKLSSIIYERLCKFTPIYDYSFDYDNAKERILKQYNAFSLEALGLADKPIEIIGAIGGLLEYVISTQKRNLTHISVPTFIINDKEMYIDYNTRKNLELTETLSDGKRIGSLIWVLDKTKTAMGARNLRYWVLHPLQKIDDIEYRQEAVNELFRNSSVRNHIQDSLSDIKDIERIVTKIAYSNINPKDCIILAQSLNKLPDLKKYLEKLKSPLIQSLLGRFVDLEYIATKLLHTIKEEPPTLTKDGGYINNGVNQELDELRNIQENVNQVLEDFANRQRELTGVPSLKVGYNRIFGYYIEITKAKKPDVLPSDYVRKQTILNGERYVNDELIHLEKEILGANERALALESEIYAELKDFLYNNINQIKQDAEIIAIIDTICSLAEVAEKNNYVKPKLNDKGLLNISMGRHPVVEQLLHNNEFVPNDTYITPTAPITLLSGPNMGGKSTYIRQVALIVLLAHIGSFVPAEKAEISIVDRIFTRVGASDNLVRGQSTFMVEMLEVANILNNATNKSLLILDEIGRGTSTLDGLSIAWAILENILFKIKAKTLFATHYHELCGLENQLDGIQNYRVLVHEKPDGITFLYKIARGGANRSFGIEVAALAGIDKSVINRAKDILRVLSESHEVSGDLMEKMSNASIENSVSYNQMSFLQEDPKFIEIKKVLNGTDINKCTPIQAITILADLKKTLE